MDAIAENNQQELKKYLARYALSIAGADAVGPAAAGVVIVEARAIAERLIEARREAGRLEALLRGLAALRVPMAPEALPHSLCRARRSTLSPTRASRAAALSRRRPTPGRHFMLP